jgi:hypothetical protein
MSWYLGNPSPLPFFIMNSGISTDYLAEETRVKRIIFVRFISALLGIKGFGLWCGSYVPPDCLSLLRSG